MHLAEQLWQRHHPVGGYPSGVVPVPAPIPGIAFFPGGYGLWRPDVQQPLPDFPVGRVMILGHDFHSQVGYEQSFARTREAESQPTWRNLRQLLQGSGISEADCFFTNVYMGLRAGAATTGRFPGGGDSEFVAHCVTFLGEQLATQRPALIVTLGIHVPPLLGRLSAQLERWTQGSGLKHLDAVGPVLTEIRFAVDPTFASTVVALTHPSLRHASVRHRSYRGLRGIAAESLMFADALTSARPC